MWHPQKCGISSLNFFTHRSEIYALLPAVSQVNLSAFAFLFSELVQFNQTRVTSVNDLEQRRVACAPASLYLWMAKKW